MILFPFASILVELLIFYSFISRTSSSVNGTTSSLRVCIGVPQACCPTKIYFLHLSHLSFLYVFTFSSISVFFLFCQSTPSSNYVLLNFFTSHPSLSSAPHFSQPFALVILVQFSHQGGFLESFAFSPSHHAVNV